MRKQRGSESQKETGNRGMESPEKSETKVEDKGEPEEAAAEIEAGGRRKEIADEACTKRVCGNRKVETTVPCEVVN